MAFSPDKCQLAAAGYQHVRLYDLHAKDTNPQMNFEGVAKNITGVGFENDGRWMFTGGEDCTVRLWDVRQHASHCSKIFQVIHPVNSVCLHPNQYELAVGDQGGTVHLWDVRTDHNEQLLPEPGISVQHVDIDPEGTMLAAVSNKGVLYVWNIVSGVAFNDPPSLKSAIPPLSVGIDSTGTGITSGPSEPSLLLGDDRPSPAPLQNGAMPAPGLSTHSPPLSPHSMRVVPKHRCSAHKRCVLKCRFSPDSTMIVTTSADNTAALWSTSNEFAEVAKLGLEKQRWVWDCAFTADSMNLITCSSDNAVRVWSCIDGNWCYSREVGSHTKPVTALVFADVEA